jgi:tellurite resistance protein TehA-like permease
VSLFFGVIILIIGLWYFATRTLGLDLPDFDWGNLWPVILIAVGILIVYRSMERRR